MGHTAQPIYKWDSAGELAAEYPSITEAVRKEGTAYRNIVQAIEWRADFRGYYFTKDPQPPVKGRKAVTPLKIVETAAREPWEGKDGMFDIDGWGKAMAVIAKADDMVKKQVGREWRFPVRKK